MSRSRSACWGRAVRWARERIGVGRGLGLGRYLPGDVFRRGLLVGGVGEGERGGGKGGKGERLTVYFLSIGSIFPDLQPSSLDFDCGTELDFFAGFGAAVGVELAFFYEVLDSFVGCVRTGGFLGGEGEGGGAEGLRGEGGDGTGACEGGAEGIVVVEGAEVWVDQVVVFCVKTLAMHSCFVRASPSRS